jgi:hypothetical protein
MNRKYAGIGSRETPEDVLSLMRILGKALAVQYTLRSGAAAGADSAFEQGALVGGGSTEIYLPRKAFNGHASDRFVVSKEALALAATLHPVWEVLGRGPQQMHARNCYQILGQGLDDPVEFVIAWTADGCESATTRRRTTGGTATAIVLAEARGIPVYNLRNEKSRVKLYDYLLSEGSQVPELLSEGIQQGLW